MISERISRTSENVSSLKHWRFYTYEYLRFAAHNIFKHKKIERQPHKARARVGRMNLAQN